MSIENQHLALTNCFFMPESANAEVLEFIDNGYSGTNFERPKVQELIEMVRANKIDCIIVKDFSRFGRNSIETGYFIERVFRCFTPGSFPINDDFDSDQHKGDTGGMDVAFKYLISEYYSWDMSIKTKSASMPKCSAANTRAKFALMGIAKAPMAEWSRTRKPLLWYSSFSNLLQPALERQPLPGNCFKRGIPTPWRIQSSSWAEVPRCLTLPWPLEWRYGSPYPGGRTLYRLLCHWASCSH